MTNKIAKKEISKLVNRMLMSCQLHPICTSNLLHPPLTLLSSIQQEITNLTLRSPKECPNLKTLWLNSRFLVFRPSQKTIIQEKKIALTCHQTFFRVQDLLREEESPLLTLPHLMVHRQTLPDFSQVRGLMTVEVNKKREETSRLPLVYFLLVQKEIMIAIWLKVIWGRMQQL